MHDTNDFGSNFNSEENQLAFDREDLKSDANQFADRDFIAQKAYADSLQKKVVQLEDRLAEQILRLESAETEVMRKNKEVANYLSAISSHQRERETMMHEINHRVMNNLQVIESVLKMKRRSLTDERAREAFENSIKRIHAMATAHGRLCIAPDLGSISLSAYLGDLINEVMAAHSLKADRVKIELDVDEIPLTLTAAAAFGQMMNELLSNCLEHGLPNGSAGKIYISLRRAANGVQMAIRDNGAGLPEGFDPTLSDSVGLNMAAAGARQLGGTLAFTSGEGCQVQAELTRLSERAKAERAGIARMIAMAMDMSSLQSGMLQS